MRRMKRFRGLTTVDKLCVGAVLLLIALALISLPPYPMKGKRIGDMKWSSDGDRIPVRAIQRIARKRFTVWAANPIVVEAVQAANKQAAKFLDEIIELDKKWTEGNQEWTNQFLNNRCAIYLKQLQREPGDQQDLYAEIFVMDRQGCIVAESEKTSDFWQGDEDKFVKAFADGEGAVFIDEAAYDESTGTPLIQVSVPVFDPNTGKAIGAMTVGLNLGVLDEQV